MVRSMPQLVSAVHRFRIEHMCAIQSPVILQFQKARKQSDEIELRAVVLYAVQAV